MALRIVEYAGTSDVGRQRETNEDALLVSPPFFAVADGMGGARAGEVASHIATETFDDGERLEGPPEAQLTSIAHDANRRIYELANRDEARRGMGTTLTAAMVSGHEVSIGHVGDSRAYRLRDGRLEQLTNDHSLVAELERTGQISAEAAEHHPQRSIITRALGPEPEVEVDTYTIGGRAGDVFLLCSDGLTSMVSDDDVADLLRQSESLEAAADALVRAANQSGGKDNITVVLFRLGEEDDEGDSGGPSASETLAGEVKAEQVREAAPAPPPARAAPPPPAPVRRAPRRPLGRRLATVFVALLVVAGVGFGLWALGRQVYFVGTDEAGLVAVYRGVPYDLPLGIHLYTREYQSGVPVRAIPPRRRPHVLNHEWRSREDAVDLVRQLERGRLDTGVRRR